MSQSMNWSELPEGGATVGSPAEEAWRMLLIRCLPPEEDQDEMHKQSTEEKTAQKVLSEGKNCEQNVKSRWELEGEERGRGKKGGELMERV